MSKLVLIGVLSCILGAGGFSTTWPGRQEAADLGTLDARVRRFLDSRRGSWRDMNVPEADGQALHDIIIRRGYKNALEIGTSTGHSGIWIAWALAKTGGKLVTIEIDQGRHDQALANFRDAGLAQYIDARLGDAHKLVPALPGPYDFVFCDADKDWYPDYLKAALPKIAVGGCFAAHNVWEMSYSGRRGFGRGYPGSYSEKFLQYARSLPCLETEILDIQGSAGISVSYKKAEK
jgi:predicted O-methyltransferase YrrM